MSLPLPHINAEILVNIPDRQQCGVILLAYLNIE